MGYLGNRPAESYASFEKQVFTIVNSQTAYTLDHSVVNENDIRLVVNNVVQEPGSGKAYTASGTSLTLSAALVNGTDTMYAVFLGRALQTINPPAASVGTSQLASEAVTPAKLGYDYNQYRNLIINGDMSVAQRATSVTGVGNGDNSCHTVDRLSFYEEGATSGEFTMSQDTDVPTGYGFAKSTKLDCTTADASLAAAEVVALEYKFEGLHLQHLKKGTSNAESLTLSFWVKTNKTGTYVANFYDNDNDRHTSQNYTVSSSNTWEKKTITFAADTSGALTNDNTLALAMYFILGAGTSYTSGSAATAWETFTGNADNWCGGQNVNILDHTDNNFWITGVQLEIGTSASDFEFLPYDVNLNRCYRYYFKTLASQWTYSLNSGATFNRSEVVFKNTMRDTPTAGSIGFSNSGTGNGTQNANKNHVTVYVNGIGSADSSLNSGATFEAEL